MQSATPTRVGPESHSLLSPNATPDSPGARRRHIACARCRRRKVRCDGNLPACTNCAKAGVECFEGRSTWDISRKRLHYLEKRVQELEGRQQNSSPGGQVPPTELTEQPAQQNDSIQDTEAIVEDVQEPVGQSPSVSVSSSITRDQPLAHEVGLLSLANASDPKYLGPSSGVPFARLLYESVPQSQGLPLASRQRDSILSHAQGTVPDDVQPAGLPSLADCQQYAEAYLNTTLLFPFLLHDDVYNLLDHVHKFTETGVWDQRIPIKLSFAQAFLILALGARILETKLKSDFNSRGLFASAMGYVGQIKLHDSIEGIQTLLLLVLHSLYSPDGLNAWFLLHTIIAGCLDLGLQRRTTSQSPELNDERQRRDMHAAIFWSAYSLDRTLTTILGRPLTLRDEAIDAEFPGTDGNEAENGAFEWDQSARNLQDQNHHPYIACNYSLRFDRIVAEIKLMIYRVSRSPRRFPWPDNLTLWQHEAEASCRKLFQEVQSRQRGRPLAGSSPFPTLVVQKLELKYHQSLMLLFRPSPQIPQPSQGAIKACFNSAMETIRLYTELHRFANMDYSWLSAHAIFVAAITIFYCIWTYPGVRGSTSITDCIDRAEAAHRLLTFLSETWSVAHDACEKLSRLISVTARGYDSLDNLANLASQRNQEAAASTGIDNMDPVNDSSYSDPWSNPGPNILVDELGILRDFFDLDWLNNVSLDTVPQTVWDDSQMNLSS